MGNLVPLQERFWKKVNKDGPLHPVLKTKCWLWTGSTDSNGYGQIRLPGRKGALVSAHRLIYQWVHGTIPDGYVVDHKCRRGSSACVNPDHLRAITHKQNEENRTAEANANSTSGIRGVSYCKQTDKWKAHAKNNGKLYWGGRHNTREEARQAAIDLRDKFFTHNDADHESDHPD